MSKQPQDTGHRDRMLNGKPLVDYVRHTIEDEARFYNVPLPSDKQTALVISALRMHTIVMHAANYDRSELSKPNVVTKYWPIESSIGRYFRDAARVTLEDEL